MVDICLSPQWFWFEGLFHFGHQLFSNLTSNFDLFVLFSNFEFFIRLFFFFFACEIWNFNSYITFEDFVWKMRFASRSWFTIFLLSDSGNVWNDLPKKTEKKVFVICNRDFCFVLIKKFWISFLWKFFVVQILVDRIEYGLHGQFKGLMQFLVWLSVWKLRKIKTKSFFFVN